MNYFIVTQLGEYNFKGKNWNVISHNPSYNVLSVHHYLAYTRKDKRKDSFETKEGGKLINNGNAIHISLGVKSATATEC